MLARVPDEMKSHVESIVQVGHLYCLKNFMVESTNQKYITFDNYKILYTAVQIVFHKETSIVPLPLTETIFPTYPMVPSIQQINQIHCGKYLTGNSCLYTKFFKVVHVTNK